MVTRASSDWNEDGSDSGLGYEWQEIERLDAVMEWGEELNIGEDSDCNPYENRDTHAVTETPRVHDIKEEPELQLVEEYGSLEVGQLSEPQLPPSGEEDSAWEDTPTDEEYEDEDDVSSEDMSRGEESEDDNISSDDTPSEEESDDDASSSSEYMPMEDVSVLDSSEAGQRYCGKRKREDEENPRKRRRLDPFWRAAQQLSPPSIPFPAQRSSIFTDAIDSLCRAFAGLQISPRPPTPDVQLDQAEDNLSWEACRSSEGRHRVPDSGEESLSDSHEFGRVRGRKWKRPCEERSPVRIDHVLGESAMADASANVDSITRGMENLRISCEAEDLFTAALPRVRNLLGKGSETPHGGKQPRAMMAHSPCGVNCSWNRKFINLL